MDVGPAPPEFEIQTLRLEKVRVLAVDGDLVVETAGQLEVAVDAAIAADREDFVVDLGAVRFMDSTGLRVILAARDRMVAGGRRLILVVRPGGQVEGLLEFTELKDQVATAPSREQALAGLGDGAP